MTSLQRGQSSRVGVVAALYLILLSLTASHQCNTMTEAFQSFARAVPSHREGITNPLLPTSPVIKLYAEPPGRDDITSATEEFIRPDPSSLIAAKDSSTQRLVIGGIVLALAVGTSLVVSGLELLRYTLPDGWFELWRDYTWPIPMGLIFVAAGIAHFAIKDTFTAIVPPPGTWGGLWQVPAPGAKYLGLSYEDYHTYWSGIAEIGGGAMLIAGGFGVLPVQIPAFLLFLLTISVTPANIYMATHDIQPPKMPPVPYPNGHYVRGILQCVILGLFWELAFQ